MRALVPVQGVAVFIAGNLLQLWSHALLARLPRKAAAADAGTSADATVERGDANGTAAAGPGLHSEPPATLRHRPAAAAATAVEGSSGATAGTATAAQGRQQGPYVIPRGGPFELVSCPHYLAEIVVYVGVALMTLGAPAALLILAWVVSGV